MKTLDYGSCHFVLSPRKRALRRKLRVQRDTVPRIRENPHVVVFKLWNIGCLGQVAHMGRREDNIKTDLRGTECEVEG
jgi:hypothetical protein